MSSETAIGVHRGLSVFDSSYLSKLPSGYSYIIADIVIYLLIDILIGQQVLNVIRQNRFKRVPLGHVSLTGNKTRSLLLVFLFTANTVRIISLIAVLIWIEKWTAIHTKQNDLERVLAIVRVVQYFPCLLFLSTYSIIVVFWAQVYFTARLYAVPMLRLIFVFLNITAYCIFAAITAVSFSLSAYRNSALCLSGFVEFVFFVVALGFGYFGIKVARQLSTCKSISRKGLIIERVLVLAVLCPALLLFRSVYYFAAFVGLLSNYYPHFIASAGWDSIILLASEVIPSLSILLAFWARKPVDNEERGAIVGSGINAASSDLRSPLMHNNYMGQPFDMNFQPQPKLQEYNQAQSIIANEVYNYNN